MRRKISFVTGEHYHVFNRGVDKRQVFMNLQDVGRFIKSMVEFNRVEPIGSLYHNTFKERQLRGLTPQSSQLVEIVAYCLNPNHFHFILRQVADSGISKFLHRVGTGYTGYFNEQYERSGALFQGTFKSVHIENNEQLLHVSVYVNLNDRVHNSSSWNLPAKSSWEEYTTDGIREGICEKNIILSQFKDKKGYKIFAENAIVDIARRRRSTEEENDRLDGVLGV